MKRFETETISARGGRKNNEDFAGFLLLDDFACWILADGLGGHGGGGAAARLAVDVILRSFRAVPGCSPQSLRAYFTAAHEALRNEQRQTPRLAQMRTTAVVLVSDFACALWGHVGDSRLYRFADGRISDQTKDHSVPQALCSAGEISPAEIRFHEDRNRLLRALGDHNDGRPAIERVPRPVRAGDLFLLCTDGFWQYVSESEMEADLLEARELRAWLEKMEERLKSQAQGEYDNYSAIAVRAAD